MCPYKMGERVRALKLLRSVTPGMLLMWDRGLHSYAMVEATVSKGCEYLGRIPCNVKFLNETQLDDGSYVSWVPHSADMIILLVFFKNQSHQTFFSLTLLSLIYIFYKN